MKPGRILVAVDASPLSLAALEAAARLGDRFGAVVDGLYVEDINLAKLAEQPEGTLISVLHARRHADPHLLITQALRLQVTQARRSFEATLGGRQPAGSFMVRRGQVVSEMLVAAAQADLVVLGWHGAAPSDRARLGSVARALAERCPRPLLMLGRRDGEALRLAVLAGDTPAIAIATALGGEAPLLRLGRLTEAGPQHLLVTSLAEGLDATPGSLLLVPEA